MQLNENSPESEILSAKWPGLRGAHDLFQNAPIGIFYSTPDGHLLAVNPCLARMYGYASPTDMLSAVTDIAGQMYADAADRQKFKDLVENRIQLTDYENPQRRRDGTIFWTSESIRAVRDDAGRILYYEGFSTDITSRRQAEEALRENQRRYREIFDGSRDGYVMVDIAGRMMDANPAFCSMMGYSLDELRDMKDFYRITPESWHQWEEEEIWKNRLLVHGYSGIYEKEYIRKDGSVFPVELQSYCVFDSGGNPEYLWGVARDISDRKQAEKLLQKSEEEYHSLVKSLPVGIYRNTPDKNGRFILANMALARMHGYDSLDEFLSVTVLDLYGDQKQREDISTELLAKEFIKEKEVQLRRKDGTSFTGSITARVIRNPQGDIFFDGSVVDITDRKRVQKDLETSNNLLQSILNAVPDLLIVIDRGLSIRYSNYRGHDRIRPDDTIDSHTCYGRFKLLNEPCHDCSALPVFETGTTVEREMVNPADGRVREVRAFPIKDADGQVSMVVEYVRDISELKQAREESRKRQQFLEAVLYHAPDAIVTLDPMHRVIDWNPGAVTMFGYTWDEAAGKNLDDLVARNSMHQEASGKTREVLSGHRIESFETIRYRKDGTPVHVIASGSPILVDGRLTGVVALYTDITVMKQNEQILRTRAEELTALNTLGRNVNATLSLQEIGNAGLQGMLDAVNTDMAFLFLRHGEKLILQDVQPPSSLRRLGDIPEHRVGECMCGLAVTENRPLYSIDIFEDSRCTWDECKRAGFRSFAALPLRSAGHSIGVIGLASDVRRDFEKQSGFLETLAGQISVSLANVLLFEEIKQELTERKRAEEALRFERERFRILVQQSPFGIMLIEKTDRLTFANPMFTEIFGYRLEEIPNGRQWFRLAFPDRNYRKQVVSTWLGDMKAARLESTQPRVLDVVCKNKGKKNIRFIIVGLKTGGYIVVFEDITERLLLEEQLQHAQKMEAVGILAGGVAHDFNNLLQAISGYTQLLILDKHDGEPDFLKLTAIEKSIERAAKLVRQLLLYSRKVDSDRRFVDLNQEIVQAIKIMERTIPRMIEIEFHPGSRLETVKADPVQIEQIFLNLGINAADAMPEGGKIVIRTQNIIIDGMNDRSLVNAAPGNYILTTVSDTGIGMDENTLKHIFEPFFTTKGVGKGTGLGLASVYGIVKGHGGIIRCDSQPGQGTTFRLYLPAIVREDTVPETLPVEIPSVQGMETILVVDDEGDIRDLASQILQRFGYGVLTAKSGEEAIQIHASPHHVINLTILDLGMPGMGGDRCLRELLIMKPDAKVVIASGYLDDRYMKQAMKSGAMGFIGKPFQLNEMLIQIRNVLENRG